MSNVVELRPDTVWVCNCGCYTSYVHGDGRIECAACGVTCSESGAFQVPSWNTERDGKKSSTETHQIIDMGTSDAARRRFARRMEHEDVVAAIILWESGKVSTHGVQFESRPQRGWLRRRLEEARQTLVGPRGSRVEKR